MLIKFIPLGIACLCALNSVSQTIMFDDFNYNSSLDNNLNFNKWTIISGLSGPPEGANYSSNNIVFTTDPDLSSNKIMEISSVVNGTSKAISHARIETDGFDYFEGTYAARVYFDESPFTNKDANIQTFYTIVDSKLAQDGSKYSEIDFEYMASDQWGTATNKQVLYMTSWNRYIADPWDAWKAYFAPVKSYSGWHTLVMSATDKTNVKFWVDGIYIGSKSITDNDGTSVYPRSKMQVAFANWIWNNQIGSGISNRKSTFKVDWTMFYKDVEKSTSQIEALVTVYRNKGVQRRNLLGNEFPIITDLDQEDLSEAVIVYPTVLRENDLLNIKFRDIASSLIIYDLLGNIILEKYNIDKQNEISLQKGVYVVKINTNVGTKIQKIVVE